MSTPIYYLQVKIAYKKNKSVIHRDTWVVSIYKTIGDIMNKDKRSMKRLADDVYGSNKKREPVVIKKIYSHKQVGVTSH